MNDLVKLTYDVFGHVIPGMIIFFSLYLFYAPPDLMPWLDTKAAIVADKGSVIIIISYIIGFAINPFGKYVYQNLGKKLWPKKEKEKKKKKEKHNLDMKVKYNVEMGVSDNFILIREKSPKNFEYIERWFTYCAMAHNLAIGSLVLALVSVFQIITIIIEWKDFYCYLNIWLPILLFSIFLFFVLLNRAVIFSIWGTDDLYATVSRCLQEEEDNKN
ncbi:MAG: hypothetical protein ABJJ25_03690 [Eudoraea sp.]|uniref:hypothetical protein n=1 Tax=Eudoraea sp. TaxID=1979955 RepID=UPI003262EA34